MDPVEWYSVALAAIVTLAFLVFVTVTLAELFKGLLSWVKNRRYVGALAVWIGPEVLVLLLILAANMVAVMYDVKTVTVFARRSARITIANMIPLSLGGHMSPVPNAIGLRFDTFAQLHRWLGRLTVIEGIIHVAASSWTRPPGIHTSPAIAGTIVSSTQLHLAIETCAVLTIFLV